MDWECVKQASTVDEALEGVTIDERSMSAWLSDLMQLRESARMTVIRRARLNQTFGYQIFAGTRRPSRDKLIQLAFGLELGIEGTCELLERGGMNALRTSCRRDVVIAFCLAHKLDLGACDDLLWAMREKTLIAPDV